MTEAMGERRRGRDSDRGEHGRVRTQRLFVAVPLPEPVKASIASLVDEVRRSIGDDGHPVRWVRIDGLHLTLRFLGPTTPERRAAVEVAVRESAAAAGSIPIRLGGAGGFPADGRPRVLWLGIREGADALAALADDLEARLVASGWPPEGRPFRPHLTLARTDGVRSGPRAAAALVASAAGLDVGWTADRIMLYESHVGGGPARYEPLLEVPLSG